MSGENKTNEKPKIKFDSPISKTIKKKKPEVKFDSMTGKPIEKANNKFRNVLKEKFNFFKSIFSKDGFKSILKRKWAKSALVIVAVIVVIACAFEVFAAFPKNKVILSAIRTAADIKNEKSLDEKVLGASRFADAFSKGNTVQEIELFDDKAEISAEYIKSGRSKKYLYAEIEKDDDVIADLYIYDDDEKRIFGTPELYDELFVYNKNKDNEQYKTLVNSLTQTNVSFNSMFNSLGDGVGGLIAIGAAVSGAEKIAGFANKIISELNPLDLYTQISVTKGDKRNIKIGDDTLKCKGYKINVPKSVIKQCIEITSKEIDKTDAVVDLVEKINGNLDSKSKQEIRKAVEKAFENVKEEVKDLELDVFIYKGRIICCEYEINTDNSRLKNSMTLSGSNNPLDDAEVSAKFENNVSEFETVFKIDTDYNSKTKDYSKNVEMKIISDVSEMGISNKLEYNRNMGSLTDKMMIISPLGDFSVIKLDADVVSLKKGKSFEIEINKLRLGEEESELEVKGKYSFEKDKEDIEVKKADIDVNDMSNKEISKAVEKIRTKLDKNIGKFDDGFVKYYYETYYG